MNQPALLNQSATISKPAIYVPPKQGIASRLPERLYTDDLHYCLAPVLYSPDTGIIAMAHIYDTFGPARYSADKVIDSLIEDMITLDNSIKPASLKAYLVGELTDSLAMPESRTKKVLAALQEKRIPVVHKVLGGQFWKGVSILERPEMLVEEYLEDCIRRYGEFHAEKEHWLRL